MVAGSNHCHTQSHTNGYPENISESEEYTWLIID